MKIAIVGYGNLGKGVECEAERFGIKVYGVFSRRKKEELVGVKSSVFPFSDILSHRGCFDIVINAGGSKTDLQKTTPMLAGEFDTVDSFDLHAELSSHLSLCDLAAKRGGNIAILGGGWDPGLFSVLRIYFAAITGREAETFWGRGVSQGHSQAIRNIRGVKYGIEYTLPRLEAVKRAERGEKNLSDRERTKRLCFVVAEAGERERIEREIREMEGYFSGYETEVSFISESEFLKNHSRLYHKGRVLSVTQNPHTRLDFTAAFDSNPRFTASILLAISKAAREMKKRGFVGAYTVADIPPSCFLQSDFMRFM